MKKKSKAVLTVLFFLFTGLTSFIVGTNLGFTDGFNLAQSMTSSTESLYFAHTLKSLREGKTESVIKLMESKLDSYIIQHDVSEKPSFAFYFVPLSYIFEFNEKKDLPLFKKAIAYRKQYPSTVENEEIRNAVHSHLEEIEMKLNTDITSH